MPRLTATASRLGRAIDALGAAFDVAFETYAQVLFSRSRAVGALLLAATAVVPAALSQGLLATLAAGATARFLGVRQDGPHGYNALLVGLGVAHAFGAGLGASLLTASASVVVVLVSSALGALLARVALPVLSLPFVVVQLALVGLAPLLPLPPVHTTEATASGPLESLGALFFLPRADAGALVLLALLVHSRIATVLAALAALGTTALTFAVPGLESAHATLLLNAALTAMALGGVWFVPSPTSFALAGVGALTAVAFGAGLSAPLARAGLPTSILPFTLAVTAVLLAARQRTFDQRPKSVDFVPGTPEENLAYFQTRLARFRALYAVTFRLPFRGAWTCTQGVDGAHTHKEAWRHAFDFEVFGDDGLPHRGGGTHVEDHHCARLPVLAAADGVVVKVVDGVPDSPVGQMDLANNWGNAVIVQHAPGLYSMVAHLGRGSLKVHEGQPVRRGDLLGLCGSSGRSPRPHLHFQLQSSPQLGAPTLPCRFSDTVVRAGGERLTLAMTPREGETVRNLEASDELSAFFALDPGAVLSLNSGDEVEHVEHEVDLLGSLILRSREHGATLAFTRDAESFTAFDPLGPSRSALHLLRAALPRVPLDDAELEWTDYLPGRWTGTWSILNPLRDLVAPFAPQAGLEMRYRAAREGGTLVVSGESVRRRHGEPLVRTTATLTRERGIAALEMHAGRTHWICARAGDRDEETCARTESPREVTAQRRTTAMITMTRTKWIVTALLVVAGCARGQIEKDPAAAAKEKTEVVTAAPMMMQAPVVEPGGPSAPPSSAAYQRSYDDEAAGNLEAALGDLDGLTVTGSAQYVAELRRGWLLTKLGKHGDAVAAYGRAIALEPGAVEPRVGSLFPLGALRRWADAEATAREVLKRDPANYTATIRLAFALYSQAKFADAEATYRTLLSLYPGDVEVRAGLGWSQLKAGKARDAQATFAEVLAVAPKNALALDGAAAARR